MRTNVFPLNREVIIVIFTINVADARIHKNCLNAVNFVNTFGDKLLTETFVQHRW